MTLGAGKPAETVADGRVLVWDRFVRLFHWSLVATFFVAYVTEDEVLTLHVWAGYAVGGLVGLRVLWGFVGPKHARFTDFLYGPGTVLRYARDLLTFRSKRYLGHSPAGGAMIVLLLIGLAATVWTGHELYEGESLAAGPGAVATAYAADDDEREDEREDERDRERGGDDVWEDLHESLADLMVLLIVLHVGGVAVASLAHGENLVRSMITGLKRAP